MNTQLEVLDMNFHWKCKRTPPVPVTIVARVYGNEPFIETNDDLKEAVLQRVSEYYKLCDRSMTEGLGISCRFFSEMQLIIINIVPPCLRIAFMQQVEKNEGVLEEFLNQLLGKQIRVDHRQTSTGWERFTN